MFRFLKNYMKIGFIIVLVSLGSVGNIQAEEKSDIFVKSDVFTVTQDDIVLLRERMKSFFQTTEKEYCRALIKIKLFSKEAKNLKIDLEPEIAAELTQMIEQKLFDIYVNRLLDGYELLPATIESYYDSHPEEFTLEDGTLMLLDDSLREQIRKQIMEAKRSKLVNMEMARLMKKYQVDIINPVCGDKEASDE